MSVKPSCVQDVGQVAPKLGQAGLSVDERGESTGLSHPVLCPETTSSFDAIDRRLETNNWLVRTVDEGGPMFGVLTSIALVLSSTAAPAADRPATHDDVHCVTFVVGQEEDGQLILTEPECFRHEAHAQLWALVGLQQPTFTFSPFGSFGGGLTAFSSMTLGKHYSGSNGTGSSITVVGSSCTGGYWNTWTSWDNRISSSYNGCARLRHYDLPNKAGTSQNTYGAGTTDNLTYMNNRTESISYHSS